MLLNITPELRLLARALMHGTDRQALDAVRITIGLGPLADSRCGPRGPYERRLSRPHEDK